MMCKNNKFTKETNSKDMGIQRLAYTPKEAAQAIGIPRNTMYALLKAGDIPHKRSGKHILIAVEDLKNWLSDQ